MSIDTSVRYNHRRVYRIIGSDLFSAAINKPVNEQEYKLEKLAVLTNQEAQSTWRISIRDGKVWLEN